MNSVNTNISALKAQQSMAKLNDELDQAMARLLFISHNSL